VSRPVPTPSQTIGPFFCFAIDWMAERDLVPAGHPARVVVSGRVVDGDDQPVPDAVIEIWQAACIDPPPGWSGFGRFLTDADGGYRFATGKPVGVGDQAPHIEVSVFARGLLQRLATRIYFPDELDANLSDPLLIQVPAARRDTLIASEKATEEATDQATPNGALLHFDIRLQGPHETVFLAF
jgi:protocatechuate 3,4-dioxygenase, alpha subunit